MRKYHYRFNRIVRLSKCVAHYTNAITSLTLPKQTIVVHLLNREEALMSLIVSLSFVYYGKLPLLIALFLPPIARALIYFQAKFSDGYEDKVEKLRLDRFVLYPISGFREAVHLNRYAGIICRILPDHAGKFL